MAESRHPEPVDLDILSETPADSLRVLHIRETNVLDNGPVLHGAYAAIDMPITAGAVPPPGALWSETLRMKGWDAVLCFVDHVVGDTTTELHFQVQGSYGPKGPWYDRANSFGLETGDSTAIALTNDLAFNVAGYAKGEVVRFVMKIADVGHFLRMRTWVKGADPDASRCVIRVLRHMSGV